MAKPNYRHAKKQKEAARKARQDAKHQRKNAPATSEGDVATEVDSDETPTAAVPVATDA